MRWLDGGQAARIGAVVMTGEGEGKTRLSPSRGPERSGDTLLCCAFRNVIMILYR